MALRLLVLSASLMIFAPSDLRGAVSTWCCLRAAFGWVLSSVSSSTSDAMSSPNDAAIMLRGTSWSSMASCSSAATTRSGRFPSVASATSMATSRR